MNVEKFNNQSTNLYILHTSVDKISKNLHYQIFCDFLLYIILKLGDSYYGKQRI